MIDVISNKIFHLHNDKVSYLFNVMENKQLGHLYYGKSLGNLEEDDLNYLLKHDSKSAGTVKYSPEIKNFTLADHESEYPVYGSSDYREGAIDVYRADEPWYLDFHFENYTIERTKTRDLKFPASYAQGENDAETLVITLKDQEHELRLIEKFTIFAGYSAIVRSQKLINLGDTTVQIHNMMSGVLSLPTVDYDFLSLSGAWLKERHIKRRPIEQGLTSVESLKGASSHQQNPFVALVDKKADINQGNIYAANLIYSGNFLSQVEVNEWDKARLSIGINPKYFEWQLAKDEEFTTPESVFYYSDQGFNGLIKETNGFAEDHVIARKWKENPRPIVFNNWEATYFDFNEDKLLSLAQEGQKLGMECFVLDDGWFGHRDDDRSSLGNWAVDRRKFPNGMRSFAKKIHDMGLEFGLWFEPEMVSPDTDMYKKHPNWVVRHPYKRVGIGRGQYVLDFANPKVVDAVYQQMKPTIAETNLDYIKWDMNRNITEAYSPYLAKINRPQGEFFHRYILGVYALYQKILTDFPNILIEGCSGGGGRFDLGILFYSPQIWPSDDSDAIEKLDILTGTTLAYPLSSFSNHVSAIPNDQVKRNTPLALRQDVSDFGPLGYELDITKLNDEQKQKIKSNIEFYKQNRQLLLHGRLQQLVSVDPASNVVSWGVTDSRKSESFIGFYRKVAQPNSAVVRHIAVPFLDETRHYAVDDKSKVSGRILKNVGLLEPFEFNGANLETAQISGDYQSWMYHLVAKD